MIAHDIAANLCEPGTILLPKYQDRLVPKVRNMGSKGHWNVGGRQSDLFKLAPGAKLSQLAQHDFWQ